MVCHTDTVNEGRSVCDSYKTVPAHSVLAEIGG